MSTFLPEGYKVPESNGSFTKLKPGTNRIRVLSSAIVGFLGWTPDKKPVRKPTADGFKGIAIRKSDKTGKADIKHFWAFFVWNFGTKQVEIMEVTPKQIMNAVTALVENDSWGDPKNYNLSITRSGEGFDTEYIVSPEPPAALPVEAVDAWAAVSAKADLTTLFSNGNGYREDEATPATPEEGAINVDDIDFERI